MKNKFLLTATAIIFTTVIYISCKKSTDDTSTSAATATCSDGIQNQNETGIDCGGSCSTVCVSCSDGLQNQGETGVDCGGPCSACPASFTATLSSGSFIADSFFVDKSSVSGTTNYRVYGRNKTTLATIEIFITAINAQHIIIAGNTYNLTSLPAGVTIPIIKYSIGAGIPYQATSGKLKFTDIDIAGGKASGEFSLTGFNGSTTVVITNGIFTNVDMF